MMNVNESLIIAKGIKKHYKDGKIKALDGRQG